MTEKKPVPFKLNGKKIYVKCGYVLKGNNHFLLLPGRYDTCQPFSDRSYPYFLKYSGVTGRQLGKHRYSGGAWYLYSSGVVNLNVDESGIYGTFPTTPGSFSLTMEGYTMLLF